MKVFFRELLLAVGVVAPLAFFERAGFTSLPKSAHDSFVLVGIRRRNLGCSLFGVIGLVTVCVLRLLLFGPTVAGLRARWLSSAFHVLVV